MASAAMVAAPEIATAPLATVSAFAAVASAVVRTVGLAVLWTQYYGAWGIIRTAIAVIRLSRRVITVARPNGSNATAQHEQADAKCENHGFYFHDVANVPEHVEL